MVPPMHNPTIMKVDQSDAKASADERVDTVQKVIREIISDRARIEYLGGHVRGGVHGEDTKKGNEIAK